MRSIDVTRRSAGSLVRGRSKRSRQHWDVARAVFREHSLTGSGAGTFRLEWERERDIPMNVTDAHSLYLEMLAELGWPGLLLLAVALAAAARHRGGAPARLRAPRARGVPGGSLALLVHAGIDWDWEMPALFAWFFAVAGIVCAAPAASARVDLVAGADRRASSPDSAACSSRWRRRRSSPRSPRSTGATRDFRAADCTGAVDGALDSIGALSSRPEPYELLGYCNLRARRFELGLAAMQSARKRDPDNWEYAYGLAVAQALNRQDPRPAAALAFRLNPRDVRTRELRQALRRGGPGRRARAAARARIPFQ